MQRRRPPHLAFSLVVSKVGAHQPPPFEVNPSKLFSRERSPPKKALQRGDTPEKHSAASSFFDLAASKKRLMQVQDSFLQGEIANCRLEYEYFYLPTAFLLIVWMAYR